MVCNPVCTDQPYLFSSLQCILQHSQSAVAPLASNIVMTLASCSYVLSNLPLRSTSHVQLTTALEETLPIFLQEDAAAAEFPQDEEWGHSRPNTATTGGPIDVESPLEGLILPTQEEGRANGPHNNEATEAEEAAGGVLSRTAGIPFPMPKNRHACGWLRREYWLCKWFGRGWRQEETALGNDRHFFPLGSNLHDWGHMLIATRITTESRESAIRWNGVFSD